MTLKCRHAACRTFAEANARIRQNHLYNLYNLVSRCRAYDDETVSASPGPFISFDRVRDYFDQFDPAPADSKPKWALSRRGHVEQHSANHSQGHDKGLHDRGARVVSNEANADAPGSLGNLGARSSGQTGPELPL